MSSLNEDGPRATFTERLSSGCRLRRIGPELPARSNHRRLYPGRRHPVRVAS